MTDDATQQPLRPKPGCDIHGWLTGEFERAVWQVWNHRVAGRLVMCFDCLDSMTDSDREFFTEWVTAAVMPEPKFVPLEVDVATDRSDPTAWCALHHLTTEQIRDHVVEVPRDKEVSICGRCMGRINGAMRIRVSAEAPERIHLNAEDLGLTPKEQP